VAAIETCTEFFRDVPPTVRARHPTDSPGAPEGEEPASPKTHPRLLGAGKG
jgi:hypothetical protein